MADGRSGRQPKLSLDKGGRQTITQLYFVLTPSRVTSRAPLDGVIDDDKALRLVDRLGIMGTDQCFDS
jgi:hypothetical protein